MVTSATVDNANNIYAVASTTADLSSTLINQGDGSTSDIVFTKFDSEGKTLLLNFFGTPDDDVPWSVEVSNDGSIYITGETRGHLDGETN